MLGERRVLGSGPLLDLCLPRQRECRLLYRANFRSIRSDTLQSRRAMHCFGQPRLPFLPDRLSGPQFARRIGGIQPLRNLGEFVVARALVGAELLDSRRLLNVALLRLELSSLLSTVIGLLRRGGRRVCHGLQGLGRGRRLQLLSELLAIGLVRLSKGL